MFILLVPRTINTKTGYEREVIGDGFAKSLATYIHGPVHRKYTQATSDVLRTVCPADCESIEQICSADAQQVGISVLQIPGRQEVHQVVAAEVMEVADILTGDHVEISNQQYVLTTLAPPLGNKITHYLRLLVAQLLIFRVPAGLEVDNNQHEIKAPYCNIYDERLASP